MHDYLPHVKYDSGPIHVVLPQRLLSNKICLQRPRSQKEERILRQAILANSAAPVISCKAIVPETPRCEGVALFSSRFAHLNNGSKSCLTETLITGGIENLPVQNHISTVNKHLMKALTVYGNHSSQISNPPLSPTRLLSRSQTNKASILNSNQQGVASISNPESNRSTSKTHPAKVHDSPSNNSIHKNGKNRIPSRSPFDANRKTKKIYLSQKQSPNLCTGFEPSAPPSTPGPDLQRRYDFIPSMSDNLAKQQVKSRLKSMKKDEQEREKVRHRDRILQEAKEFREKEAETKRLQRRHIYTLNTEMTSVENKQFENFKAIHGLKNRQYPEPKTS